MITFNDLILEKIFLLLENIMILLLIMIWKKCTYVVVFFPDAIKLSERKCYIKLYDQSNQVLIQNIIFKSLNGFIFKSRKFFMKFINMIFLLF